MFWMFVGVIFYSIIVGTLTSIFSSELTQMESVEAKMSALESFQAKHQMDE